MTARPAQAPARSSPNTAGLGRVVVLSAVLPLDATGRVVAGGIREQTRRALERLREAATRAGVSLERAAAIHVYLRDAADFAAMNEAYAPFFPADPPTRTTVVAPPVDASALVAIAAIVIPDDQPREVVHPAGVDSDRPTPTATPSAAATRCGCPAWCRAAGRTAAPVDGDVGVQTRVVLDNARAAARCRRVLGRRRRQRRASTSPPPATSRR